MLSCILSGATKSYPLGMYKNLGPQAKRKSAHAHWINKVLMCCGITPKFDVSCEQYVAGMFNIDHVNGLLLDNYKLNELRKRNDVEILKFNISYEGHELRTPEIKRETMGLMRLDSLYMFLRSRFAVFLESISFCAPRCNCAEGSL